MGVQNNNINLPAEFKIINLLAPAADAAGRTGAWVSMKHAHKAWILCHINQGNAATILLTLQQATAVAGTGAKVLTNNVPIWVNQATATNDTLVLQTSAVNFTTSATTTLKQVIFEVDPATLDVAGGFDCLTVLTGASNAANITAATAILQVRYLQGTPPSSVLD
jgi:hypothetical protein